VGCAMAALSTAYAGWAVLRQLGEVPQAVVFGLDAEGEVGALCLTRPC